MVTCDPESRSHSPNYKQLAKKKKKKTNQIVLGRSESGIRAFFQ